jgi:hypothetical protein
MILGFAAEKSLSYSLVPDVVALATELAKDKQALSHLHIHCASTASYKMKHGLAKTMKDQLIKSLQREYFSLNIDEAFSENNKKILAVLVNLYDETKKEIVTHHLESVDLVTVNSETVFKAVDNLFSKMTLDYRHLVSVLLDSCPVMRGCKSGLEKQLRDKAPHLLDIDGDTCHHLHNASKRLCLPFKKYAETLFNHLYTDFKYSPDLRDALKDICEILGMTFTMPQRFISHR